jgi:hypothetical protein
MLHGSGEDSFGIRDGVLRIRDWVFGMASLVFVQEAMRVVL